MTLSFLLGFGVSALGSEEVNGLSNKTGQAAPVSRLIESRGEGDEDGVDDNGGDVAG